jgi:hypothetical protein
MLNCRQASELMSQSLDTKLSLRKRWSLKLHLMMCRGCSNFRHQVGFLRHAAKRWGQRRNSGLRLSDDAKSRIANAIQDFRNGKRLNNDDNGISS